MRALALLLIAVPSAGGCFAGAELAPLPDEGQLFVAHAEECSFKATARLWRVDGNGTVAHLRWHDPRMGGNVPQDSALAPARIEALLAEARALDMLAPDDAWRVVHAEEAALLPEDLRGLREKVAAASFAGDGARYRDTNATDTCLTATAAWVDGEVRVVRGEGRAAPESVLDVSDFLRHAHPDE